MYITKDDLYQDFGRVNVRKWASFAGDASVNVETRIEAFISQAEGLFNDRLRKCQYLLPLTTVDETVKMIVKGLAIELIYAPRSSDDEDQEGAWIRNKIKKAYQLITEIQTGSITLSAQRFDGTDPECPVMV